MHPDRFAFYTSLSASVLALVLLLSSCGGRAAAPEVWVGGYTWGHEVNSFCPCGSTQCYWVSAASPLQAQLREFAQVNNSTGPYQAHFLRFRGELLDQPREGFALDYDGLIRVEQILELGTRQPGVCP